MKTHSLSARAFVALQYLLPQHLLSRGVWWLTRSRSPWLSGALIRNFMSGFSPDMSDALQPDPGRYVSFNDFFTRALREDARPLPASAEAIACPVDGTVSMAGATDKGRVLQAKGRDYSLESLLAGRQPWIRQLDGGRFATLYLAPFNYHRIHMPLAGTLREAWYVPGRLFSVNGTTAAHVPALFARNERVILGFEGEAGCFAVVLVGALFVGSMTTVWHGDVTPAARRRVTTLVPRTDLQIGAHLPRGAELGRFNMGSTVIVLLPPGAARWDETLAAGRTVRVGETIGHWAVNRPL